MAVKTIAYSYWRSIQRGARTFASIPAELKRNSSQSSALWWISRTQLSGTWQSGLTSATTWIFTSGSLPLKRPITQRSEPNCRPQFKYSKKEK